MTPRLTETEATLMLSLLGFCAVLVLMLKGAL
jgi:hypothetical protein